MQLTKSTPNSAACSMNGTSSPSFSFSMTKFMPTSGKRARVFHFGIGGIGMSGIETDVHLGDPAVHQSLGLFRIQQHAVAVDPDLAPGTLAPGVGDDVEELFVHQRLAEAVETQVHHVRKLRQDPFVVVEVHVAERVGLEAARAEALDAGKVAPVRQLDFHSRRRARHDERPGRDLPLEGEIVGHHARPQQHIEGAVLPELPIVVDDRIEHHAVLSPERTAAIAQGADGHRLRNQT